MFSPSRRASIALRALAISLSLIAATRAAAECNVIPGTALEFRGAVGSLNRPFAIPGDEGEEIAIRLRPGVCDPASSGFANRGATPAAEDDYFVSVLFEPPGAAPHHAVVLGSAVNLATCQARIAAAPPLPNGGTAECHSVVADGVCSNTGNPCTADSACAPGVCVSLPGTPDLSVRSECVGGATPFKRCSEDSDCAGASCEPVVLTFRFPDTDARVDNPTDDRTLAGPATIVVTPVSAPLPFGLSGPALRCADPARPPSVVACVDELYTADGTCNTSVAAIDATFGHFTALPPANDYQAACTPEEGDEGSPCIPLTDEVRFTVDAAGNVLLPMDYRGVLIESETVPIPRIVSGTSTLEAFSGGGTPVDLPSDALLSSHAPGGQRLPPLFTPLRAETPGPNPPVSLFGSVDAPVGVIRIQRHACSAGPSAGEPCLSAADCGGQACSPLFDFSDRFHASIGPVLLGPSDFTLATQEPVSLDGLLESPSMFAFVTSEAIENVELNADADTTDPVLRLRDRSTGAVRSIGSAGKEGRAVTRVRDRAFRFPAVSVEDDLVAFLESEPLENATDANGNGEAVESILRVYRMSESSADELTGQPLTADAAPLVEGRSATISNGRVFFRTSESEESERVTTVESVLDGTFDVGVPADPVTISANGRTVAFESSRKDLAPNPNPSFYDDVYVRDRGSSRTVRVSQNLNAPVSSIALSADGRFVVYEQSSQIWLHDRDVDADGVFDSPDPVATELVSCKNACAGGPNPLWSNGQVWSSKRTAVSPDGRFVAFISNATDLLAADPFPNHADRAYLRDRNPQHPQLVLVSIDAGGGPVIASSVGGICVSTDGRFASFTSSEGFVVHDLDEDGNGLLWYQEGYGGAAQFVPTDLFETERADLTPSGADPADAGFAGPFGNCLSDDGRFVTFYSTSPDLVAGDTNGTWDVFVRDREAKTTTRLSVAPSGEQGNNQSDNPNISRDGRFVTFSTESSNLDSDNDGGRCEGGSHGQPCANDGQCFQGRCATPRDVLIADLSTGHLRQVSTSPYSSDTGVVADGGVAATFIPHATPGPSNPIVRVRGVPLTSVSDRSGDGRLDDTVLRVLDASGGPPGAPIDLCPAGAVAVADGRAAFLRPEAAGPSTASSCAQPGADLNGDGDVADEIVHLWSGGPVSNLGRAGTKLALSGTQLAFLVSEAEDAAGGASLSASPLGGDPGDDDKLDTVLFVCAVDGGAPSACTGGGIVNTGLAADGIAVSGDVVVAAVAEASQNATDLNGDGDAVDRVLRIYRADTGAMIRVGQAVEDFVINGSVVAFRTRESRQGNTDLNGDGDTLDDVLQAYDVTSGELVSSGMAVTPCPVEACDPRFPYRVSDSIVTFVTQEQSQSADLNGDGDETDLVKQVFNVAKAVASLPPEGLLAAFSPGPQSLSSSESSVVDVLASANTGICTTTGSACWSDSECGGGRCFLPPGQCLQDLGEPCDPTAPADSQLDACDPADFCVATGPSSGSCHRDHGSCTRQSDCGIGTCSDAKAGIQPLAAPITTVAGVSGDLLVSSGRCVRPCNGNDDCDPGDSCDVAAGRCQQERGSCLVRDDCEGGLVCTASASGTNPLVTAAAADTDGDGLVDPIDNCPEAENPDQLDGDGDGLGNACDASLCGDQIVGMGETCDDGNLEGGDGCSAGCRVEQCSDGLDNDGDGQADHPADPGCTSAADLSERELGRPCDDGVDDDGDGFADHPADPSCQTSVSTLEQTLCSDGLDNDGDGGIDWNGVPPDPQCAGTPWGNAEATSCGLGFEIVLLALPLIARSARWRRRPTSSPR